MLLAPSKPEIDHRTLKLLVGLMALSLPFLTNYLHSTITSISESYCEGGSAQSIFVGFLFAIAAFLLAYNGLSLTEMVMSKVAGVAALVVALFPCGCEGRPETVPHLHYAAAAVMFLTLAYFCHVFYKRARKKGFTEAKRRAVVYAISGFIIMLSMLLLALDLLPGHILRNADKRLAFHCESAALLAFGVSWLTASRTLPVLSRSDERLSF